MADRIDELPENALAEVLNTTERLANELKNRQLVSGGNIRFFTNDSGNTYDWQGTLTAGGQFPGAGVRIFRVTATAVNMENLFADLILEIYDGAGNMYTFKEYLLAINNGTQPQFYQVLQEEPVDLADSNKKVWSVGLTGLAGQAAKFKVYVVASDEVTLNFVSVL
jgi:hypothetical protein